MVLHLVRKWRSLLEILTGGFNVLISRSKKSTVVQHLNIFLRREVWFWSTWRFWSMKVFTFCRFIKWSSKMPLKKTSRSWDGNCTNLGKKKKKILPGLISPWGNTYVTPTEKQSWCLANLPNSPKVTIHSIISTQNAVIYRFDVGFPMNVFVQQTFYQSNIYRRIMIASSSAMTAPQTTSHDKLSRRCCLWKCN